MLEQVMQKERKMMPKWAKMGAKIGRNSEKWWKKGMQKTMPKFDAEQISKNSSLNQSWLTQGSIFGGAGGLGEARNWLC